MTFGQTRLILTTASLLILSFAVKAEDFRILPSIGYGISNLSFTRSGGKSDVSRFNVLDFSLTASKGSFYLRTSAEVPLGEETTFGPSVIKQFKRDDYGFATGYYFSDQMGLFGGYSYGVTSVVTYDGSGGPPLYPVYTQHLDAGPFVGVNYSIFVGAKATIGLNLAYASMRGSLVEVDTNLAGVSTTESGSTNGYSFGATWSDAVGSNGNYYVSYKFKRYKTQLTTLSIEKDLNIFSLGFVLPI